MKTTLAASLFIALVAAVPVVAQPRTSPETPAPTKPGPDTSTAPATSGSRTTAGGSVEAIQTALKDKGYDPGPVDGRMGSKTRAALRAYQKKEGLPVTGNADAKTLAGLKVAGASDAGAATPRNTQKTEAKKPGPGASTTTPQAEMAKDADASKKK